MPTKSVEWRESHDGEYFLVVAMFDDDHWNFFERSIWEVRWYPLSATPERIAKASTVAA